jgi:hypothetical protein
MTNHNLLTIETNCGLGHCEKIRRFFLWHTLRKGATLLEKRLIVRPSVYKDLLPLGVFGGDVESPL